MVRYSFTFIRAELMLVSWVFMDEEQGSYACNGGRCGGHISGEYMGQCCV